MKSNAASFKRFIVKCMRACLLQKSIGFPQLHTGGSVLTFGCWEPNPGPKKYLQVLVTTQPSLQALSLYICVCISTHSREGWKTICGSQMPSPQDLQVLRIQPRSSGLVTATIRQWATSLDLTMYLYLFLRQSCYIAQICNYPALHSSHWMRISERGVCHHSQKCFQI